MQHYLMSKALFAELKWFFFGSLQCAINSLDCQILMKSGSLCSREVLESYPFHWVSNGVGAHRCNDNNKKTIHVCCNQRRNIVAEKHRCEGITRDGWKKLFCYEQRERKIMHNFLYLSLSLFLFFLFQIVS